MRLRPMFALLLAASLPLHAAEPLEYYDARKLADADEAGVTGPARDAMLAAQRKLLDAGVVECSLGKPQKDFSAFAIVMRLDAQGLVQQTWREGGSPLAICLQRYVRDKTVFVPPKAPLPYLAGHQLQQMTATAG